MEIYPNPSVGKYLYSEPRSARDPEKSFRQEIPTRETEEIHVYTYIYCNSD